MHYIFESDAQALKVYNEWMVPLQKLKDMELDVRTRFESTFPQLITQVIDILEKQRLTVREEDISQEDKDDVNARWSS